MLFESWFARWAVGLLATVRSAAARVGAPSSRILVLLFAVVLAGTGVSCSSANLSATTSGSQHPDVPPPSNAITIDIGDVFSTLAELPEDDVPEQLRDWAVYGTLTQLDYGADEIAQALHRTSPLRLPYLEEMVRFDYGRGRRALVGSETLLFYDHDDPDKVATLGRLADRVRMETGEIPATVRVFEVEPDEEAGEIRVHEQPDVQGSALFGEAYGYREAKITDEASLRALIGAIDDLASARKDGDSLILGGRRFPNSRTRTVDYDDVAVLYQAHDALSGDKEPGFSLDPQWKLAELADTLDKLSRDPCEVIADAAKFSTSNAATADDSRTGAVRFADELRELRDSAGSLLPVFCGSIYKKYHIQLEELASEVRLARRLDPLTHGEVMARVHSLAAGEGDDQTLDSLVLRELLNFAATRAGIQCARYDGPLQGTRVGMNLFYTDLLAKLWQGVDAHHSAPVLAVPGFRSMPRTPVETIYRDELERLPGTRIWFGPFVESISRSGGARSILFQHVATRIYAAGSNPLVPGDESQPNEPARRAIGWWDRHYEQVADYEQEYHVQNQIIKWSVVTGWMHEHFDGQYLKAAKPDRSQRFDRWYQSAVAAGRLRYTHPIPFRPELEWPQGTECIDLLGSYGFDFYGDGNIGAISGGVTAGGKAFLKEIPELSTSAARPLRRPIAEGGVKAGTAARAQPVYESAGKVASQPGRGTRWRSGGADAKAVPLVMQYELTPTGGAKVALSGGGRSIGELSGERAGLNVKLDWRPGGLQVERAAVAKQARASAAVRQAESPAVAGSRSEIYLADEKSWVLPSSKDGNAVRVTRAAPGSRAATVRMAIDGGKMEIAATSMSEAELSSTLEKYRWQELSAPGAEAASGAPQAVRRTFQSAGPPPGSRELRLTDIKNGAGEMRAYVTKDGKVLLERPSSPEALSSWRNIDVSAGLTPKALRDIVSRSKNGSTAVALADVANPMLSDALRVLESADRKSIRELVTTQSPDAIARLQQVANDQANFFASRGMGAEARHRYDQVAELAGRATPELEVRRGLASLQVGRVREGWTKLQPALDGVISGADKKVLQRFISSPGADGLNDVRAVLNGRMGGLVPGAPAAPKGATIRSVDGRLVSTVQYGRLTGKQIQAPNLDALVGTLRSGTQQPHVRVVFYIDDSLSMNRADFAMSPGETLAQVRRMPNIDLADLDAMPAGDYRPSEVVDAATRRRYEKVEVAAAGAGPTPAPRGLRIIRVRDCDRDRNGRRDAECANP